MRWAAKVMDTYPARYTDTNGSSDAVITNDGHQLQLHVRDTRFCGRDFDSFEPDDSADPSVLALFCTSRGSLCNCVLEWTMPIMVSNLGAELPGLLRLRLELGTETERGSLSREDIFIILEFGGQEFSSSGKGGWFEDELNDIQDKLPAGILMRACINCLYSDYSPSGHGLFGWMLCFRNRKADYLRVKSKDDFWRVHDYFEEMVQETYLCQEFERRVPGTGYRG
jgi:hypothetical protein